MLPLLTQVQQLSFINFNYERSKRETSSGFPHFNTVQQIHYHWSVSIIKVQNRELTNKVTVREGIR